MRKTKTQEIVYGAMMLAIYALFMIMDRYSGGMLYLFLYYFLPLPFVVYGLKFGVGMFGALSVASLVLGFVFGLPETAFFGFTAILVSYMIVTSIQKNWSGTKTMIFIMLATVISQVLSVTVFASLFGYDMASEIEAVVEMVESVGYQMNAMQIRVIFPFSIILMGCLEAVLFTTLTDLVLLRLKMARMARFSIMQLHFPKVIGYLYIIFFVTQMHVASDLVLFTYLILYIMILAQGISYCFLLNAALIRKPILNSLAFIGCFIPFVNYFMVGMGLIDIFSENRKDLMYNR